MSSDKEFVEEYRDLVHGIAQKVRSRYELTVEIEDLQQFGFKGLLEARERFDASRGVKFKTFAYYRVRGAMIDGVRKMAFLPRRAHEKLKLAEASDHIAEQQGGGERSTDAAAEKINEALGKLTASFVVSAMGQSQDDADESPEEMLLNEEAKKRVRSVLGVLPEREMALVQGFYFDGRRFDEVAEELGISKSWASRLHTKALERLKKAMQNE